MSFFDFQIATGVLGDPLKSGTIAIIPSKFAKTDRIDKIIQDQLHEKASTLVD